MIWAELIWKNLHYELTFVEYGCWVITNFREQGEIYAIRAWNRLHLIPGYRYWVELIIGRSNYAKIGSFLFMFMICSLRDHQRNRDNKNSGIVQV